MKTFLFTLSALLAVASAAQAQPKAAPEHKVIREIIIADGEGPHLLTVQRGFLGVSMSDLTSDLLEHFEVDADAGVMISSLVEDGPAERAGIQVGDILVEIDGESIGSQGQVALHVGRMDPGSEIQVAVVRDRQPLTLTVEVGERERGQVPVNWFSNVDIDIGEVPQPGHVYRYKFSTGPGEEDEIVLNGAPLMEVIEQMRERVEAPEFQERIEFFRSHNTELESRLQEMEQRLADMGVRLAEALSKLTEENDQ